VAGPARRPRGRGDEARDKPGIVVYPSAEQIERFQLVANLLQTTVERLLITCTLADLNTANDWYEWQDFTQHHLARYEDGSATMGAKEKRIEHEVPDRLLALAGYKLPVKPKKGGK